MFKWLFRERDFFTEENDDTAKAIYKKVLLLNKDNKYKARIIMDYMLKAVNSDSSLQDLYGKIYVNTNELEILEKILSFQSPIAPKKYKHYKGNIYTTIGVALPIKELKDYIDYDEVRHTEDNVNIIIYKCHQFLFHDYNDDVLMIYADHDDTYARPYEMFFSTVEHEGKSLPRFKKIEE
jgi:hypothetical protein